MAAGGPQHPHLFDHTVPALRCAGGPAGQHGRRGDVHPFAEHSTLPIPPSKIDRTLTSVRAVQRHVGPDGVGPLLQQAFALADTRTDLLRDAPARLAA